MQSRNMRRITMRERIVLLISFFLLASLTWSQQQSSSGRGNGTPGYEQYMSRMDMPAHDMSNMKDMSMPGTKDDRDTDASLHAMHSMEGHMDMGAHMKMTALRPVKPGDAERARGVVEDARKASTKYIDYHAALADGYKIFHPEVPQEMYHFTNYQYAIEAAFNFKPEHPTSLLYEKH